MQRTGMEPVGDKPSSSNYQETTNSVLTFRKDGVDCRKRSLWKSMS